MPIPDDTPGGVIRWETPPPSRAGSNGYDPTQIPRPWATVAQQLREHPGDWGVISEWPTAKEAWLLKRVPAGVGHWKPAGAFAVKSRTVNQLFTIYAVYIGPNGEYAPPDLTSGGVVVTEERIEKAADEAEQGYDVDRLRDRGDRLRREAEGGSPRP